MSMSDLGIEGYKEIGCFGIKMMVYDGPKVNNLFLDESAGGGD